MEVNTCLKARLEIWQLHSTFLYYSNLLEFWFLTSVERYIIEIQTRHKKLSFKDLNGH